MRPVPLWRGTPGRTKTTDRDNVRSKAKGPIPLARGVRHRLTRPSVLEEAQMGDEREEELNAPPTPKADEQPKEEEKVIASPPEEPPAEKSDDSAA